MLGGNDNSIGGFGWPRRDLGVERVVDFLTELIMDDLVGTPRLKRLGIFFVDKDAQPGLFVSALCEVPIDTHTHTHNTEVQPVPGRDEMVS